MEPPLELDPKLGWSLNCLFLSVFIFVPAVLLNRNNSGSEFLTVEWQPHPLLDVLSFYWRWTLQVPSPYCRAFHLRSLPLSSVSLSAPRSLVHSGGSLHLLPSRVAFLHSLLDLRASVLFSYPITGHTPLFPSLSPFEEVSINLFVLLKARWHCEYRGNHLFKLGIWL